MAYHTLTVFYAIMHDARNARWITVSICVLRALASYTVASVSAGTTIIALLVLQVADARAIAEFAEQHVLTALKMSVLVGIFAAVPVLIFVNVMRFMRGPRGWTDVLFGALTGAGLAAVLLLVLENDEWDIVAMFAFGGAIGGLVYWLAAGRSAAREQGAA